MYFERDRFPVRSIEDAAHRLGERWCWRWRCGYHTALGCRVWKDGGCGQEA